MRRLLLIVFTVSTCLFFFSLFAQDSYSFRVKRIAKEELKALLDNPETVIIDVRLQGDWDASDKKIKGAVHEDPLDEEKSWAGNYSKDKNIVLY